MKPTLSWLFENRRPLDQAKKERDKNAELYPTHYVSTPYGTKVWIGTDRGVR